MLPANARDISGLKGRIKIDKSRYQLPTVPEMANISLRPKDPKDIIVPYLLSGRGRVKDLNRLAAFFISHYYVSKTGESYEAENLVGAMVGYLMTILNPEPMVNQDVLKSSLQLAGINITYANVSPGDIKILLAQEPRCQDLLQRLGRLRDFEETGDIWACLGGVILLAIGKQVNPDGYTNWFTKRCTAFAGSLGNPNIVSVLKATTAPSLGSMVLINSFLSACRELRGDIFRLVLRGAQADGRNSNTLKDIAMLLKGAEMSHICMIDEYLYCRYPEILLIRPLHDNSEAMTQAWEYLATIPQDERYYVKLLRPKSETDLLNRNNFLVS